MVDSAFNADEISIPRRSLKARVFQAGRWTLIGHFAALVLRLANSLILTRIFTPDVFGVLAIITAVQVTVELLTDVGLRPAVVQSRNGNNRSFVETAWTLQIIRGFVIWSVATLIAFGLALLARAGLVPSESVYAQPDLPTYIVVISLGAVMMGFQSMKSVMASRALDVKRLTAVELFAQIGSLVFVAVVGVLTRSIWAYIAGSLLSALITVAASHFMLRGPPDRIGWDSEARKELFRFGRWTFLSSLLSALAVNGDRMLLSAWLSAPVMGYFSIASNLSSVAEAMVARIFGTVSLPALSEALRDNPRRFAEAYFRMRWVTDSALLFVAGGLFAAAPLIIHILYDPRYASAGWILRFLSFSMLFSRYGISQSAYLALGRPDYVTILSVTKLVSLFSLVPVLFYWFGVHGAVLGIAFHMLPSALCTLFLNGRHALNSTKVELLVLGAWVLGWGVGFVVCALAAQFGIAAG